VFPIFADIARVPAMCWFGCVEENYRGNIFFLVGHKSIFLQGAFDGSERRILHPNIQISIHLFPLLNTHRQLERFN